MPYLRKQIVNASHLDTPTGPPWIVLWETSARSDDRWNEMRAPTEAGARESVAHFLKLGFVVHAIKDPSGKIAMDAQSIKERFARNNGASPAVPERRRTEPEYVARAMMRNFDENRRPIAGLMIVPAVLQTRLSPLALDATEFDRGLSFAADRGWLTVGDGVLTLTQDGCVAASG